MLIVELVAQGLVQGSIYALIALGLTLVYGLLRILHVAHAALFTLGAYMGVLVCNASGSLLLGFIAASVISGVAGGPEGAALSELLDFIYRGAFDLKKLKESSAARPLRPMCRILDIPDDLPIPAARMRVMSLEG